MTHRLPMMYRFVRWLLPLVLRAFDWRVRVDGIEHVPLSGAVVASNHVAHTDPLYLGRALDRDGRIVRYLAKRELFESRWVGPIVRGAMQIPVDRRGDPSASLVHAEAALLAGHTVVVFPEGTIHPRVLRANVKSGAARLAIATGAPLVPGAVWGGQHVGRGALGLPSRSVQMRVRFGPPIQAAPGDEPAAVMDRLVAAMTELADAVARDYPDRTPRR